jgi:hypothetical protein
VSQRISLEEARAILGQAVPTGLPPIPADRTVLALDVSSSVTGWAIVGGSGKVEAFGRIAFSFRDSLERIDQTVRSLEVILDPRKSPTLGRVVMEWQSHKHAARLLNAQGLAVLGQAQGHVRQFLKGHFEAEQIETVSERDWNRSTNKQARGRLVYYVHEAYRKYAGEWPAADEGPENDPKLDVADAIGLGLWRTGHALLPERQGRKRRARR